MSDESQQDTGNIGEFINHEQLEARREQVEDHLNDRRRFYHERAFEDDDAAAHLHELAFYAVHEERQAMVNVHRLANSIRHDTLLSMERLERGQPRPEQLADLARQYEEARTVLREKTDRRKDIETTLERSGLETFNPAGTDDDGVPRYAGSPFQAAKEARKEDA